MTRILSFLIVSAIKAAHAGSVGFGIKHWNREAGEAAGPVFFVHSNPPFPARMNMDSFPGESEIVMDLPGELALAAGCNDFIRQPVEKDALLALMRKYFPG